MTINTNLAAVRGQNAYRQSQAQSATSLQRLSTGLRINSAKDDPAGLIAATDLNSEITKLAAQQSGDDRLYIKAAFADSVLGVVSDVLRQAKSITIQNANTAGLNDKQIDANQAVLDAIVNGVQRIGEGTTFLGDLLFGGKGQLQSDASAASASTGTLDPKEIGKVFDPLSGETFSLEDLRSGGALSDNANPKLAAEVVSAAISQIADQRAELGSFQNALTSMGNVRGVTRINLASALSQIQDTDFAQEAASYMRNKTLSQNAIAVSAIANSQSRSALALLAH